MALVAEYKNPLPQTEADIRHVLNHIGPELFGILMDMYASAAPAPARSADIDRLRTLKSDIIARGDAYTLSQLAITGNDLISLGHTPGPALGTILNTLLEEVIENPALNTHDNLIKLT